MKAKNVTKAILELSSPAKAKSSAWFFKTEPGQYGEGDRFIGVTVPEQRKIAKQYRDLPLIEIKKLLASPVHEHRFTALEILVLQYEKTISPDDPPRDDKRSVNRSKEIVNFYLDQLDGVNNWDLVDTSAPYILGDWLLKHPTERSILTQLARSNQLWRQRVAMVATQTLIRAGQFEETFKLAKYFLNHQHDLIHKAVGWMLREVGKRDRQKLTDFLDQNAPTMPRTMLRYAIEKFVPDLKKHYLGIKKVQ